MAGKKFDRGSQDVGNILALEHVNVRIPDQVVATLFYVVGLGLTRDPYLMVGIENMWANAGQQQFHLPTGRPQVLRGCVGLVVPDLEALKTRLGSVSDRLAGTRFGYAVENKHVSVTCPWGNRIRCHAPGPEWGDLTLGMPYVEFPVEPGCAPGIAAFYHTVFRAPAAVTPDGAGAVARVQVGVRQELVFRETREPSPPYDGHHIAIYIADFSEPHRWLAERGLVTEESSDIQYRFTDIVDPETARPLFTIEHEVRCVTHPMYLRPLINRNPAQRQATYVRGRDAFVPPVDERVTREELKRVHAAIERHAEAIVAIGEQIRRHPELGFKEWKTAALVEAEFRRLGLAPRTGLALTGLRADVVGGAGLVGAARSGW